MAQYDIETFARRRERDGAGCGRRRGRLRGVDVGQLSRAIRDSFPYRQVFTIRKTSEVKLTVERRPVTVHYRKFERAAGSNRSLEELVRLAMNSPDPAAGGALIKQRYLSRLQTVLTDNLFINTYADGDGNRSFVFGDILHFTKGHLQALCQTADPEAPALPVQQMTAPEQSEYVHSQMFWMIKGDHVFVVQSMSLRTAELEQHLGWLLSAKTALLPPANPIILNASFDASVIGGDLNDIQEIVVGGVASQPPVAPVERVTVDRISEVTQHNQIDTARATERSTAWKVLRELLGGDANVESLMSAVPADAELNVQVHIGYTTKKRRVDRVALRQLETGLRNLPDSQLQVRAKGARQATDGSIRLHHQASVRLIKAQVGDSQLVGSLLDPADVQRAALEAYDYFLHNGKIQE